MSKACLNQRPGERPEAADNNNNEEDNVGCEHYHVLHDASVMAINMDEWAMSAVMEYVPDP